MKKHFISALLVIMSLTFPLLADNFGRPGVGTPGQMQTNYSPKDIGSGRVGEDGAYTYSYPMGPVSLNYHSDGGWSWSAGSMISRSTKKGVPNYTVDDLPADDPMR